MRKTFYLFQWNAETKERKKVEVEAFHVGGNEWKALCPFHDDHDPSLGINEEKGVYHCLGCDAKGQLWKDEFEPDFPEVLRNEDGEVVGMVGSLAQFLALEIERLKKQNIRR